MTDPSPIDLREARTATTPAQLGRKMVMVALAALVISTTIAWFGLIGWGTIEFLRVLATAAYRLWTGLA